MKRPSPFRPAAAALVALAIAIGPTRSYGQQETTQRDRGFEPLTPQQVEERLADVTRLELQDVPLADAMQLVSVEHNLPVFLDRRALEDVGVDAGTPVSADYTNLSLGTALELMLREWDLTYVVDDGAILITTPEEAEQRLETQVYSVYDLVQVHDWMLPREARQGQPQRFEFEPLISLVTTTIHPASWDVAGGPGTITNLPPDLLIVTQTREVQEEVGNLLETLRRLPPAGEQPGPDNREPLRQLVGAALPVGGATEKHHEIRGAIDEPTKIEAFEVPLAEVVRQVGDLHAIPVLLDRRALEDVGIDPDTPITAEYRNVPLGQALGLLLHEYDLTYLGTDEVLLITSQEVAEQRLSLRVYPVIDLVRARSDEEGWLAMDFEPLLNVLMTGIDQNSWDVVGGAASVKSFPQRAALVVHQTQRTHEKIESLLADLRRHRQDGQPDVAVRPAREEVVPQVYQLTIGDLSEAHQQALRGLIKHSVRPESWGSEGGQERFITFLPGRIIVHNRRDVQAEVVELLLRLGLIVYPGHLGGGVGGGFGGGGGFFAPVPER